MRESFRYSPRYLAQVVQLFGNNDLFMIKYYYPGITSI